MNRAMLFALIAVFCVSATVLAQAPAQTPAAAAPAAGRRADHQRAGHPVDRVEFGRHVDELVHRQRDEIHEHDFDHGPLPCDGRADRDAG